jgi:hypothetical protein
MTTENQELKPCFRCGSKETFTNTADFHEVTGEVSIGYFAGCFDCGIETIVCRTKEEAYANWNRRVAPAVGDGRLQTADGRRDELLAEVLMALQDAVRVLCNSCQFGGSVPMCDSCNTEQYKRLIARAKTAVCDLPSAVSNSPLPGVESEEKQ